MKTTMPKKVSNAYVLGLYFNMVFASTSLVPTFPSPEPQYTRKCNETEKSQTGASIMYLSSHQWSAPHQLWQ